MIHLYLEEFHVSKSGENFACTGNFIARKYLGSTRPMEMLMDNMEKKHMHLKYFNDLRIFKFTWHNNRSDFK